MLTARKVRAMVGKVRQFAKEGDYEAAHTQEDNLHRFNAWCEKGSVGFPTHHVDVFDGKKLVLTYDRKYITGVTAA